MTTPRPDPARPRVLSVAGIDPCGGAGLVADVRCIEAAGGFAMGVPSCRTEQDRTGFRSAWPTGDDELSRMLDAVAADGPVAAVKTGLFVRPESLARFAVWFAALDPRPPLVVDPVLSATAGGGAGTVDACLEAYRRHLLPLGPLVTPNLPELERLAGGDPAALLAAGARGVLVKGGHAGGGEVLDVLHLEGGAAPQILRAPRLARRGAVHGTGCAVSAFLATFLALGESPSCACETAVEWVQAWIAVTPDGPAPTPLGGY